MKATNLTISIDTPKCTKGCPYCISEMTHAVVPNLALFRDNLPILMEQAKMANVNSVLFTGKGEPTDNFEELIYLISKFKLFPTELQTNGLHLLNNPNDIKTLKGNALNVIAISIDQPDDFLKFKHLFKALSASNIIIRVTIILSQRWQNIKFSNILHMCRQHGVRQLTLRQPSIPNKIVASTASNNAANWISKNNCNYHHIILQLKMMSTPSNLARELPFGITVYDIEGIGVTTIEYCIQENSNNDNIRSLIYQADGHLYTTWDKPGSIIF